ncbi:MAG: TetR family transcriptional regulator C-terminal domain-containing protein [Thermodesulfobacteriota bacterium]
MAKPETKQMIIESGARIIHQKGYHHTGIQEVLQAAGIPKGSFYFYFASKEDFGLQVIDYFNNKHREMVTPIISDKSISPVKRLEKLFDWFISRFIEMDFTCGCPIGNLSQEMGDLSPAFRSKLNESIDRMVQMIAGLLQEGKETGEVPVDLDLEEAANFIVSGWHGALIRMKIVKAAEPLENHKRFIFHSLLKQIDSS